MTSWQASPRVSAPREQPESCHAFYDLVSEVTLSFLQNPIGYTSQPYSLWEGTTRGHKRQEARVTGAILAAGYMCINSFSPSHVPREA